MNAVAVTFVVPVYNVEKYLNRCVESILNQNLRSFEIIFVNDGSTDNSDSICREYAQNYNFVRLIEKQNEGISAARNDGLAAATGEYVCFIDSDDYYKIEFANEFLNRCRENSLDIIRGWYDVYDEDSGSYLDTTPPHITYSNISLSGREFLVRSVMEKANEVVPWLGFFRREYLIRNNLKFPDGIAYEEDQLFFLNALLCDPSCRVMQTDMRFYAYRKRQGSATKTSTYKQAQDVVYVVGQETNLIQQYPLSFVERKAGLKYACSSFYQLTSIYGRVDRNSRKKIASIVPFKMKFQCICNPYDKHQFIKIFLFTFARFIVDFVYARRRV